MNVYELKTEKTLREMGANGNYYGFKFVSYGVKLIIDDPTLLTHISKGLYINIASKYDTTPFCVERDIRTIKGLIWKKADEKLLELIFNDASKLPSNSIFFDYLAAYIFENVNN